MSASPLQLRLEEYHRRRYLEEVETKVSQASTLAFLRWQSEDDDLPELERIWRVVIALDTDPDEIFPGERPLAEQADWINGLLEREGFSSEVWISLALPVPWILVRNQPGSEWLCELSQLFPHVEMVFLNHSKSKWIAIGEGEDRCEAFTGACVSRAGR